MTDELLASCWTTAGNVSPMHADQTSPFPLSERLRAAAAAGYVGAGLVHADLIHARDTIGYAKLRAIAEDHGIRYLEVEMLTDWLEPDPSSAQQDLLIAAAELGARQIKVGGSMRTDPSWDYIVDAFGRLCEAAARYGSRIALEPMPFTNIENFAVGRHLIDAAGHDAGGLMVDLWHVARGKTSYESIIQAGQRYIFAVELDDADNTIVGTLLNDTVNHRKLCGHGSQDLDGFITTIRRTGYPGPWGVEIIAEKFRKLPLETQARESFAAANAALLHAATPPGRPRGTTITAT